MTRNFQILLVEDDDPLRACLDEFLADRGFDVRATGLGQEAVDWAKTTEFDFSILDFHLPGMTAVDVLQAIRQVQPLPSILMSGEASPEERKAGALPDVFEFLRKPLDLNTLHQSVEGLIARHFGDRQDS